MRVKICGINSPSAFDAAVWAGADYVGFVFYPPSPRAVTPAEAFRLSARALRGPKRVGLFVAPDPQLVSDVLTQVHLDVLQIHGVADVTPYHHFYVPLWHAVGISTPEDLPGDLHGADEWLLDAKPPLSSVRPGGNAVSFDWNILAGWQAPAPWWLAGGLTPDNVAEAIRISGAKAVDVSSGVESAPGVKDAAKIAAFVENARGALGYGNLD
jgi:phosphoribosylanthranilate isomerase